MRATLPTLALLALAAPLAARELAADDRAAIAERVAAWEAVLRGDAAAFHGETAPRLRAAMAEDLGFSEAEVEAALRAQVESLLAIVTIDGLSVDLDAATVARTPDGSMTYALVPTVTEMTTVEGSDRYRIASETLAFEDDGEWWLLRMDDPVQVRLLAEAYPAFDGVEVALGRAEPVE